MILDPCSILNWAAVIYSMMARSISASVRHLLGLLVVWSPFLFIYSHAFVGISTVNTIPGAMVGSDIMHSCCTPYSMTCTSFNPRLHLALKASSTGTDTDTDTFTNTGVTFQYSPTSLLHLEAVERPQEYGFTQSWSKEKFIAMGGAFGGGITLFALSTFIIQMFVSPSNGADSDADKLGIIAGGIGFALGWYMLGGGDVMEEEQKINQANGGYDAKLIADRPKRLQTVLDDLQKSTNAMTKSQVEGRDISTALRYIRQVHDEGYIDELEQKCQSADRPMRLNPSYARTLIDEHSYDAAVQSVQDWLDSVDHALDSSKSSSSKSSPPIFALTRPPGHHACKSKGMGGCLLNAAAIAAFYALDQPNVNNVAILDIDAHHGNGIAHCIQDEARIRYCSIHEDRGKGKASFIEQKNDEDDDDPRKPDAEDCGPLKNIYNVNLPSGTGWENGYKDALVDEALPFLLLGDGTSNAPDLLIVSAGFDALDTDWSSKLKLQPSDFGQIGRVLRSKFDTRIAMGLEGGYSFENHALSDALVEFSNAWRD